MHSFASPIFHWWFGFYVPKIRIVLTIDICSKFWYPENHWEAEQGCDHWQDVGKAPFFNQPAKLFETQRCWCSQESRTTSDSVVRRGQFQRWTKIRKPRWQLYQDIKLDTGLTQAWTRSKPQYMELFYLSFSMHCKSVHLRLPSSMTSIQRIMLLHL